MSDTLETTVGSDTEVTDVQLPALVQMLREHWTNFNAQKEALDEKLGSSDGPTAISRAAVASLPSGTEQAVTSAINTLFAGASDGDAAALTYLLRKEMKAFDAKVKAYVDANTSEVPTISDEESAKLREERKQAVADANNLRTAVLTSARPWAEADGNLDKYFPELTNPRGGGTRKSAPRLKGSFIWSLDGRPIAGDKIEDLAKAVGVGRTELKIALNEYWKSTKGTDFPFADAPDSWSFEFTSGDTSDPEGHTVYTINAARRESDTESDDDSDDDTFDEPDEGESMFGDDN